MALCGRVTGRVVLGGGVRCFSAHFDGRIEKQFGPVWEKFAGLSRRLCPTEDDGSWEPILDVASGPLSQPGLMIAKAMPHARVVLADVDEGFVAATQKKVDAEHLPHTEVTWVNCDEGLPFEDHSFDMVTCCFGMNYYEHKEKAVSEFLRVLKPGCELILSHWKTFKPQDLFEKVAKKENLETRALDALSCGHSGFLEKFLEPKFDIAESKAYALDLTFPNAKKAFDAIIGQENKTAMDAFLEISRGDSDVIIDESNFRLTNNTYVITVAIKPPE